MKKTMLVSAVLSALFFVSVSAQFSRFPYVQSLTDTSVIIAWKTPTDVMAKIAYGNNSANLTDTLYETNLAQKHAFSLTGLQANTKYYYEIYSGNTSIALEYFTTAKDESSNVFSFLHYGDCGYNNNMQRQIGALMEADSAEFAVVCGDIDQGGVPHISASEGGDDYDDIYFGVYNDGVNSKMLAHECHFTSIGNHDTYADNGATYENEFYLPHNNPDSTERYYSFEWGNAKFIALDVITPFDPTAFPINFLPIDQRWWTDFRQGSAQYQWLEQQLQCNEKEWVFIYFHEGPWTNYWGIDYNIPVNLGGDYYQYDGNVMVRQHLVPLFEQYNVDFVLVGHSHLYEKASKNGVMYITSGSAGDDDVTGGNTQYANHPEIQRAILDNVFVKYYVNGNSLRYDVINKNASIIDSFFITKPANVYNVQATITNVSCYGYNDGTATLTVTGAKAPYTVEWFDGTIGNVNDSLTPGTHYAYVRNRHGCEKVTSVTITEPPLVEPEIVYADNDSVICANESVRLKTTVSYNSYLWSNGANDSILRANNMGVYSVEVADSVGCIGVSNSLSIDSLPDVAASFNFVGVGFNFNFLSYEDDAVNYYWNFDDGTDTITTNTLVNHVFPDDGYYNVQLIVENECNTDTLVKEVKVGDGGEIEVSVNRINAAKPAVLVYPNPAEHIINFDFKRMKTEPRSLKIIDGKGQEVYRSENITKKRFAVNLSQFQAGVYFYLVSGSENIFGEFVVVK